MTIPFNELTKNIQTSNTAFSGYFYNHSGVENKHISMLMLCILYHNEKISRKSFTTRIQAEQSLDRRLHTYKSIVLDKWFSDTHITDVLIQEVKSTCNDRNLTFDDYFRYLNIGLSRNRNWVVNWIAFSLYKAMLYNNASDAYSFINESKLIELSPISYDEADQMYDLSSGYCCDDCDGDYYGYKQGKYQHYYRLQEDDVMKQLFEAFKKLKTHLKNPDDKLLNEFL